MAVEKKVAAFVTRDVEQGGSCIRQLLVFRHDNPRAGIQVPAGTVEPGEAIAAAVLREVAEEAGLIGLTIVGDPVRAPLELDDGEWYLALNDDGRETMRRLELGHPCVRIARDEGEHLLLAGERADGSPVQWRDARGSVTRDVRRWLFHLRTVDAPDTWERAFDTPHPWAFFWVPADSTPPLVSKQAEWLRQVRPLLLADVPTSPDRTL